MGPLLPVSSHSIPQPQHKLSRSLWDLRVGGQLAGCKFPQASDDRDGTVLAPHLVPQSSPRVSGRLLPEISLYSLIAFVNMTCQPVLMELHFPTLF